MNTAKVTKNTQEVLINVSSKERVLAAALKLFVGQGYFNTNIPDLSRESRCSVGSIYHHFKNKEEIAKALYDLSISIFRKELEKLVNEQLLKIDGDRIKLTNKGLDFANIVWEEFV